VRKIVEVNGARTGYMKNTKFQSENQIGSDQFGNILVDLRILLNWTLSNA
jgi:hypothetical protein